MTNRPKIVLSITDAFCLGFLRGQAKFLKDKGFDVYLFCPEGEGLDAYGEAEGCTIVKVPYKREISPLDDLKCLFITYRHFKDIKPDIINVGTPKAGLLGVIAGTFAGVKNLNNILKIYLKKGVKIFSKELYTN